VARSSIIKVTVLGDVSDLVKSFQKADDSTGTWVSKMEDKGKALTTRVTLPIIAGFALTTKAAAEEGQQMETLATVIRNKIPNATQEAIDANEEWITSTQNATATADSDLRDLEQRFLASGASIEESQKRVAQALDISAATGKDLDGVVSAMIKGAQGSTGAFAKLGVATKTASGQAKTFDEIMQDLAVHQGTAAEKADTTAGRVETMQLKMADLAESIGAVLLPVLDKLVAIITPVVDWFNQLSPAAEKIVVAILAVVAAIGPLLLIGAKVVQAFNTIKTAWLALQVVLAANPFVLIAIAVVALVTLIVLNWDKIVAFLKEAWEKIKTAAATVWQAIKDAIKGAVDFIVKLFLNFTLPGLLIKHWDKIKEGVMSLVQRVKDIWNGLVDWFKSLPGKISAAVANLWDGIRRGFAEAINWIVRKWNNFSLSIRIPSNAFTNALGIAGKGFSIETPNIPTFQRGGVFHAPQGRLEGLAVLHEGERVLPAGSARGPEGSPVTINITAGIGADPAAIGRAVVEALQRYQRANGPLPLAVRGSAA
jgi:phage-related minor tail protein